MRLKQYLKEKYYKGVKTPQADYVEFFTNPSKKEMAEVGKSGNPYGSIKTFRFIADNKKKIIYIWTAALMHADAWKHLGGSGKYFGKGLLAGIAEYEPSGWEMISATSYVDKAKEDWNWVEKYVKVKDFLYGEQA